MIIDRRWAMGCDYLRIGQRPAMSEDKELRSSARIGPFVIW